ncbi:hypothetical protein [Cyanobium sp. NIES-981]|uniref:hypothetical protein n=1 Tax=Cyanobium sp. NIES-981 TaxID=1851505 RepID=UPI0007DD5078|nr:hypothetical protein [Cyanobium sp. NIES-981]SBO43516.1 conserved protein of unknown function [Cyanobium sp. NIES-981]
MNKPQSSFSTGQRITRRRSSAGPLPPTRPVRPRDGHPHGARAGLRPTFLTLRDHGKVYVADLPRLSDGQLAHIAKEAREVLESLLRRLGELEARAGLNQAEQDTRIRASTKRDVTERFIRAIDEEQDLRRNNPALRAAAGESLARAFMELARHRLPGATFDSLLQEALTACGPDNQSQPEQADAGTPPQAEGGRPVPVMPVARPQAMPVVLTPAPAGS